jgi:hypothetical protein
VLGILIFAVEHPIGPLGSLFSNYFLRSAIYFLCLTAMVFEAPMQTAGLCLFCAAFTYLVAALHGESWSDPAKKSKGEKPKEDKDDKAPKR